jgi:hypothetical protein
MTVDYALASQATTPIPLIRPYRSTSGALNFPPTREDLVRSILPAESDTSTTPKQVTQAMLIVTITDGFQQIVLPKVTITSDHALLGNSLSLLDNLNTIKSDLSLSVTQIADLFNVTRKAVYDWYDGAEPRANTVTRINALADVLSSCTGNFDVSRLKSIWKIPVSGQSFLNVLNDEGLDATNLQQALTDKLNELSPRLAAPSGASLRTSVALGQAHLSDIDRRSNPY